MPMIPFKLIISESHLTFTFFILAVVVSVLTAVAILIINAVIVSVLIFFFYWFYMRPTKDCKTRTPSSSSPLQKSFSLRLQPLESGGVRETGVNEHQLILTNDNDIRRSRHGCIMGFKDRIQTVTQYGAFIEIIFNTLFGLSTSFWFAISVRFLLGCVNCLLGVIRVSKCLRQSCEGISTFSLSNAYASEVASEEYHALCLSVVSTSRGIGLIIGPAIGGYLAQERNTTILSENATIRSENATILAELASQKKFNTEIMQKLDRLMS
ncbi:hypothetical protein YC2023_099880 [Brassica napus]